MGDCDKCALTGGAIYELMMKLMKSSDTRAQLKSMLKPLPFAILVHWVTHRQEAIMMHVEAIPTVAMPNGQEHPANTPPMGHSIIVILPTVRVLLDDNGNVKYYYVPYVDRQGSSVFREISVLGGEVYDEKSSEAILNGVISCTDDRFESILKYPIWDASFELRMLLGGSLLGEMTAPCTPYAGIDYSCNMFTTLFRTLDCEPGSGGLLHFSRGHYVKGVQAYSATQTRVVMTVKSGAGDTNFPDVDTICQNGTKTVVIDTEKVFTMLTKAQPVRRSFCQNIALITHETGVSVVDKLKTLQRDRGSLHLFHVDDPSLAGWSAKQKAESMVCIGSTTYSAALCEAGHLTPCNLKATTDHPRSQRLPRCAPQLAMQAPRSVRQRTVRGCAGWNNV